MAYGHERLSATLTMAPTFDEPLQHFEQWLTVTGRLVLDGRGDDIDAVGFRTRTWGFRDGSQQVAEYFFLWSTFDDYAVGVERHQRSPSSAPGAVER